MPRANINNITKTDESGQPKTRLPWESSLSSYKMTFRNKDNKVIPFGEGIDNIPFFYATTLPKDDNFPDSFKLACAYTMRDALFKTGENNLKDLFSIRIEKGTILSDQNSDDPPFIDLNPSRVLAWLCLYSLPHQLETCKQLLKKAFGPTPPWPINGGWESYTKKMGTRARRITSNQGLDL